MTNPIEAFKNAVASETLLSMARAARLLNAAKPNLGQEWAAVVDNTLRSGDELAALQAADHLIEAVPGHVQSYIWKATVQSVSGDHKGALTTLEAQLARFPEDATLRVRLGREALLLGRTQLARSAYADALRINPQDPSALEGLAETQTFKSGDPILGQMEEMRLSWPEGTPSRMKGILSYALAKAYDDIGEYEAAARRVSEAAAFYREDAPFDTDMHEASTRQLIATYDDRFISANEEAGVIDSRPVFLTAPPCSGVDWLADVLSADETAVRLSRSNALFWMSSSPMGEHDSDALLRELALGESGSVFNSTAHTYLEYVTERVGTGFKRVIDPSTLNEIAGGAIGLCLPAAKMIQVKRDPRDLAWAIYRRRFRRGRHWTYHPEDIARVIACYERLAGRWRDLYPDRVLQVRYEDMLSDPAGQAKLIAKFAGVDVEAAASEAWLLADRLRSDPAEIWTRAGSRFEIMEAALERAGLIEGADTGL